MIDDDQDRPLASAGRELVEVAHSLGTSPMATALRAWLVPHLFHEQERLFAATDDPTRPLAACLKRCADRLRASIADVNLSAAWPRASAGVAARDVEGVTANHYGNLFAGFSKEHYWDEATALLRTRLERNGVPLAFETASVLDAGCGGGRYTVAWKNLGAARATGIDMSPLNIATAESRVAEAALDGVDYREGNVLALDVPADSYDVVFSNGVLHHTVDWATGVRELVRVLKRGGLGWLYLIENPGGLFWDTIEILRTVLRDDSHDLARGAVQLLQLPQHRVFYMLDHVMVPINVRLRPDEIEAALAAAGARDIRRLARGADFDRVEQIHRGAPHATVKFGVGENRYVFTK
jgi:ubiquinone/menaquinone biosynthesis C-methylase UbiE